MWGSNWKQVTDVTYDGSLVFSHDKNGDLAFEPLAEGHLVDLPDHIETAIKAGVRGQLR